MKEKLTWSELRNFGIALGHEVAKNMPEELPPDITPGMFCDLAIDAQIDPIHDDMNLTTMPICWDLGDTGEIAYRLGRWIYAIWRGDWDAWDIEVPASPGDVQDYYKISLADYYHWGYETPGIIKMRRLVEGLSDTLDTDGRHKYSAYAYRRLDQVMI